jgi:two-component system uhpT operon response regulator UhpA
VAIVDDHRLVVDGIVAHLTASAPDFDILIHTTSWMQLVAHDAFPVDVVVLDLNLEDGIAIGAKVRALSAAGSYAVVVSRHSDQSSIYSAIKAGAMAFIPKTESADELVLAIRTAAQGIHYQNLPYVTAHAAVSAVVDPRLGKQERRAMVLYSTGRSIREVAQDMQTTEETIKSYIKRGRRKYRDVGVDLGTKSLLRHHGVREGWLAPE